MNRHYFYYVEDKLTGDGVCISEAQAKAMGKSRSDINDIAQGIGVWLWMELRVATAGLERSARSLTLVMDELAGMRTNDLAFTSALFCKTVSAWGKEPGENFDTNLLFEWGGLEPTMADFDNLPCVLADSVEFVLKSHFRPNSASNPDFFTRLSAGSSPR